MKFAYADPPYPGCAHLYRKHPDYADEAHAHFGARIFNVNPNELTIA